MIWNDITYALRTWVQNTDAVYWGDVDTHGYVILDRARRILPGLKSVLMDRGL